MKEQMVVRNTLPYNIKICANLGHLDSQPPQQTPWFVRR